MSDINYGDILGTQTGIVLGATGLSGLTLEERSRLGELVDVLNQCDPMLPAHRNLPEHVTIVPRHGQNLYFGRLDLPESWSCDEYVRFFIALARAPRTEQILVGYHPTSSDIGGRYVGHYDDLLELLGATTYHYAPITKIYVRDARNKMPLQGVSIALEGVQQVTRPDGSAEFYVPGVGYYNVEARANGYASYRRRVYINTSVMYVDLSPNWIGGGGSSGGGSNSGGQTSLLSSSIGKILILAGAGLIIYLLVEKR